MELLLCSRDLQQMGIKGLTSIIQEFAPNAIKQTEIKVAPLCAGPCYFTADSHARRLCSGERLPSMPVSVFASQTLQDARADDSLALHSYEHLVRVI